MATEAKHRDPEWLAEKYHSDGLSQREIADGAGVSQPTVSRLMDEHDIESREKWAHCQSTSAGFHTTSDGYERAYSQGEAVYIHRLAAVAWFGYDAVVDRHTHHLVNVQWDNREANFLTLSTEDHNAVHHRIDGRPYYDREWLKDKLDSDLTVNEIAEEADCHRRTIYDWKENHGL